MEVGFTHVPVEQAPEKPEGINDPTDHAPSVERMFFASNAKPAHIPRNPLPPLAKA
jgi:hypothetical protein